MTTNMLRIKSINRFLLGSVRNAGGGGGRPGGKPTFNWKQRASLGLQKVQLNAPRDRNFPRSPHLYGDVNTIRHWLSDIPPEDHVVLEGPNKSSDEQIAAFYARLDKIHADSQKRSEPKLDYSNLFGPNKAFGMIPVKKNDFRRNSFTTAAVRSKRRRLQSENSS